MTTVDSTALSLALRRRPGAPFALAEVAVRNEVGRLLSVEPLTLIGAVRQELLTGIRERNVFERLRDTLSRLPDELCSTPDYERAAEFANTCRARGVQGSPVDFLICAVAARLDADILTSDADFVRYADLLPIRLHPLSRALS